jgi:hypothetical protein
MKSIITGEELLTHGEFPFEGLQTTSQVITACGISTEEAELVISPVLTAITCLECLNRLKPAHPSEIEELDRMFFFNGRNLR